MNFAAFHDLPIEMLSKIFLQTGESEFNDELTVPVTGFQLAKV